VGRSILYDCELSTNDLGRNYEHSGKREPSNTNADLPSNVSAADERDDTADESIFDELS
jgi:hypothetical protein